MSTPETPLLVTTADGTPTLRSPHHGAPYHSLHGAVTESRHVFIDNGLTAWLERQANRPARLRIVECGFGTGLNAALAWSWARTTGIHVEYVGLEPFPIPESVADSLGYANSVGLTPDEFSTLHAAATMSTPEFSCQVIRGTWSNEVAQLEPADVIFFDAFSPTDAPELWTVEVFRQAYDLLAFGGLLTTYCAKGEVRRNLELAGFVTDRLEGPPGKREMLTGIKHPLSRFNVRVYAVILDSRGERILISREDLPGGLKMKFPGGGLELGEGLEDALHREIREELGPGIQLANVELLHTTSHFVRSSFAPDSQVIAIHYRAQFSDPTIDDLWTEKFSRHVGAEPGLEFKWRRIADLQPPDLDFATDRFIIEKLKR